MHLCPCRLPVIVNNYNGHEKPLKVINTEYLHYQYLLFHCVGLSKLSYARNNQSQDGLCLFFLLIYSIQWVFYSVEN